MTVSTPQAVSWAARLRTQLPRRVAGSLGVLILLTGVAPAMANAAGGNVPNPVSIALQSSSRNVAKLFSAPPAADDGEGDDADHGGTPDEACSPSATPDPTPSVEATATEEPDCDHPSATPTPSETNTEEPGEDDETDEPGENDGETDADDTHGAIVSTVARCAPKGKDPLLALAGAGLANHGSFVKVAAHGGTLVTSFGTFDLSTLEGANAFCTATVKARAALPTAAELKAKKAEAKSKAAKAKKAKSKAKKAKSKAAKAKTKAAKAKVERTKAEKAKGKGKGKAEKPEAEKAQGSEDHGRES